MADGQTTTPAVTPEDAESMALDAESRVQDAPTQDERERWQRIASYWWGQA